MSKSEGKPSSWLPIMLCLAGIVATVLPTGWQKHFRSTVRDGLKPGLTTVHEMRMVAVRWSDRWERARSGGGGSSAELEQQLEASRIDQRRLLIANARLQQQVGELETMARLPKPRRTSQPLIVNELVAANVVGHEKAMRATRQATIDAGKEDGLDEAAFVVDGTQPLLDQGADSGVKIGMEVYSGRAVVGRILATGRWTSSLRLVTDSDYRALARLGRPTRSGMIWGSEGRLKGNGTTQCGLHSIDATQLVSEGDLVFTSSHSDDALPDPMYYGRVVKAELRPGAVQWDIIVEPAADLDRLQTVHVLRQKINPLRMMAQ
jgi:rod shape-determining protein MreC